MSKLSSRSAATADYEQPASRALVRYFELLDHGSDALLAVAVDVETTAVAQLVLELLEGFGFTAVNEPSRPVDLMLFEMMGRLELDLALVETLAVGASRPRTLAITAGEPLLRERAYHAGVDVVLCWPSEANDIATALALLMVPRALEAAPGGECIGAPSVWSQTSART